MQCQLIEYSGDSALLSDTALDRLKCGRQTVDRSCPWCEERLARVFRLAGEDVETEESAAWRNTE